MAKPNFITTGRALRAICLATIIFGGGFVHGQTGSFGFDGRIVVPDPHFNYPPIEIRLLGDDFDGQTLAYAYTEATGSFAFKGLAPGSYYIVVHVDGYQNVVQRVDLTARGGVILRRVNVILKPNVPDSDEPVPSTREGRQALEAYGKALKQRTKGQFDAAAKSLETAVTLVPEYPAAHLDLGEVYLELHRRVDAEREFRIAYELSPENLRSLLNLGRIYLEEADVQIANGANPNSVRPLIASARDFLTEAVIRNPNSAMAGYLLGSAYFRAASYETAEKELIRALSIDKELAAARLTLINVYVVQQKWQSALDTLDKFLAENPSSPYAAEARTIRNSVVRRLSPTP